MPELAPPVVGGRVVSRQGCRTLPRYTAAGLRPIDLARCAQAEGRVYRWHNGIDIGAPEGSAILAPAPCRIVRVYQLAGYYDPAVDVGSGGYGRTIVVELWPGALALFAHCAWTRSDVGAFVQLGEQIATVGRTEGSAEDPAATFAGPHLHLEMVRRWPLRSSDVDQRFDVAATLAGLGIVEDRGRHVWAESAGAPSSPGGVPGWAGPFPAEGIAPGEAMLSFEPGPAPSEPVALTGQSGPLILALGAILWRRAQRRRGK